MEVTRQNFEIHNPLNETKSGSQQKLEAFVDGFRSPIFGLDTQELASYVARFSNPEKTIQEIKVLLESSGSSATEIAHFERDMVEAMATRFESKRILGIAVDPFIDTVTDWRTHLENGLDACAAAAQGLTGVGQLTLSMYSGLTPAGAFFATHGLSNLIGGFGDIVEIISGKDQDIDLNLVRQGYENLAEFAGIDKSVGTTVHTVVGVASSGYGLLIQREVLKYPDSALEHVSKVSAVYLNTKLELASEIAQGVNTAYEANRERK
ncbi:MAG: hypothetical protein CSA50_06100 [Gammaproteobacteria bacterium]|nr:MAG: hypothetical protein CSA50_06100 [Gammaproteobacteria bacterium]